MIIIIALAPLAAVAQDVKIAYLNAQEIFSAMPELPGIETKLTTKQEEINKNGQALVDEFNKKKQRNLIRPPLLVQKPYSKTGKNSLPRFRKDTRYIFKTANRRWVNYSSSYSSL